MESMFGYGNVFFLFFLVLVIIRIDIIRCMNRYCVVFDPLDGSSNIDCGVSIGTVCFFSHPTFPRVLLLYDVKVLSFL